MVYRTFFAIFMFAMGASVGSFALATAWRIKKKKNFTTDRSECEMCHHTLAPADLLPIASWLMLRGKCRYCHKKLPGLLPVAEIIGAMAFGISFLFWPVYLHGVLAITQFVVWCAALVLLLILLFYDLQWGLLPNKVMYPLWGVAVAYAALRFVRQHTFGAVVTLVLALVVSSGVFWAIYHISKGAWIGYGDVRLGIAMGLLAGTPLRAAIAIFGASLLGTVIALPGLVSGSRKMQSRLPFGPLLIAGLIISVVLGRQLTDWYVLHILPH